MLEERESIEVCECIPQGAIRTGLTMAHRLRSGHHCGNGSVRLLGKQGDVRRYSIVLFGRLGIMGVRCAGCSFFFLTVT